MKITLDTNILHQEGYKSQNMQVLARLAEADLVKLYVADLVLREHDSKRLLDTTSKIQSINQNLRDINKIFLKSGISVEKIESIEKAISELDKETQQNISNSTLSWLTELKISKLDFSIDCYKKLWDDYFEGAGAFKKPKNREDIPDAVIGLCIMESAKIDSMVVICKDGQLKGHLAKENNLAVYDELASFIASQEIQHLLSILDSRSANIEKIKTVIDSDRFRESIFKYISAHKSDLWYACWQDDDVENTSILPLPVRGAISIGGPLADTITDVTFGSVACVEPRHYVMPIQFFAQMPVSFVSYYMDWIHLPNDKRKGIDIESMDGDGVGDFTISKIARVTGQVVIYFLEEMTAEAVLAHAQFIGHDNCKLDVEYVPGKLYLI
ncbi:PIN domain-containing protein [Pseudomonas poae]|jgi:hypothetical protein|uniref:PIN domain-containing protein n=1 Tax=Pseudomonas poae TaxID=200451 RepID=UPI0022A8629E|nr:PIN domain-containing protein [Pseudomonas poae]